MLNALRSSGRKKGAGSIIVWIILGLIIIGLTGFGLGGAVSGLASQNVARVGGEPVEREDFVRAMFRDLDLFSRQTGRRPTMTEAQALGIDDQVLSRLITVAALDKEARALSLSVDDRIVGDQLMQAPAFQGLSGTFDQQSYDFFLDRQGLTAKDYEEELRKESARLLLQASVAQGVDMPDSMARTILAYLGEQRGFSYAVISPDTLATPLGAPTEADLQAQYEAQPEAYTRPETRQVRYVALQPGDIVDQIEVPDEEIQAEYEARGDIYNTDAARVIDQISFPDMAAAEDAKARVDAGEVSFADLAAERDLSPADISRGRVAAEDLGVAAREVVFGAEGLGIVGPVTTDLGPALFRINGIVAARTTPLEDVADDLRAELALEEAGRRIGDYIDPVQDLLASGATLQEIADETDLVLGEAGVTALGGAGIAADAAFRAEALQADVDEDRDLIDLAGGGIAALRVTAIDAPALRPLDEVRDQVVEDWTAAETQRRLTTEAEALQAQLGEARTFASVAETAGLSLVAELPRERGDVPSGVPGDLLTQVFALGKAGETVVISDPAGVYLVQLDEIVPVDLTDAEQAQRLDDLDGALSQQVGTDLFIGYAQLLRDTGGVEVNERLIRDTLAQYP